MFSLKQDKLLISLGGVDTFALVPSLRDRAAWTGVDPQCLSTIAARAEQALAAPIPILLGSMFASASDQPDDAYRHAYVCRREMLKALVMGTVTRNTDRYLARVADLSLLIAEETNWTTEHRGRDFPDPRPGVLDRDACETAALLTLTAQMCLRDRTPWSNNVLLAIERAIDIRVVEPLITREENDWFVFRGEEVVLACRALLIVALIGVREERARWLALRRVIRLLESYMRTRMPDGGASAGLERHAVCACALADCLDMLHIATAGEVDSRDDGLFTGMASLFCQTHVAGRYFVNPGGQCAMPDLSPETLFRLGKSAGDAELCELAAYLKRVQGDGAQPFGRETDALYPTAMNALGRKGFLTTRARVNACDTVERESMHLLLSRADAITVALMGGVHGRPHADAGDIALYYKDRPVLLDPGGEPSAVWHSVPVVNGYAQQPFGRGARDMDSRFDEAYRLLSMDIADAYPQEAGLVGYQRTVMRTPFDEGVRVVDVFDFGHRAGEVTFRFVTPIMPRLNEYSAQLGGMRLEWERGLDARMTAMPVGDPARSALLGDTFYRIELTTRERLARGNFTFILRPEE